MKLFETDIKSPLRWRYGNYSAAFTPDVIVIDTPTAGFFMSQILIAMSISKNCSPAPTITEQTANINPVREKWGAFADRIMRRVMDGERFNVKGDRMGFTYRFERENADAYTFFLNNLLVGVMSRRAFFKEGFVITLNVLGDVHRFQVLVEDIRFITDNEEGGARC